MAQILSQNVDIDQTEKVVEELQTMRENVLEKLSQYNIDPQALFDVENIIRDAEVNILVHVKDALTFNAESIPLQQPNNSIMSLDLSRVGQNHDLVNASLTALKQLKVLDGMSKMLKSKAVDKENYNQENMSQSNIDVQAALEKIRKEKRKVTIVVLIK